MNGTTPREFNCKNEELPIISGFVALSLERDLASFTGYSPVFDQPYLDGYKASITAVQELVAPKSETVELKLINEHTYSVCDGLIDPINHLEGYIQLAGASVPMSATDFGLVKLRKSARTHEVESVLPLLLTIDANITKYYAQLTAKGLTGPLKAKFLDARTALADDKNKRYTLVSSRAALVQNNMGMLNALNAKMVEICDIGKILFKQTDKAKLKDYTFAQLMKQVRRVNKPEEDKAKPNGDAAPEA
jgi:hypothetical protein